MANNASTTAICEPNPRGGEQELDCEQRQHDPGERQTSWLSDRRVWALHERLAKEIVGNDPQANPVQSGVTSSARPRP